MEATSEALSDSERPPFEDAGSEHSDVEAGYLPLGKSCYDLSTFRSSNYDRIQQKCCLCLILILMILF